jgi:hypothetical protein
VSITYEIMVDWDATDWRDVPDFSEAIDDITRFVKRVYPDRGEKLELGNYPAGTLDLILINTDKRFSPPYAAGPLFGKIRPWLPVRVRATITGGSILPVYFGYIADIEVDPHLDVQEAYLYCTDGLDLMARNMISVDTGDRTAMTDGEAVNKVADAAGWPAGRRAIDVDTPPIVNYPAVTEY